MSSIFDLLLNQLGGDAVGQISRQIGAPESATKQVLPDIIGVLTGALAKNASRPDGAEALAAALDKDHDGGILDNVTDFINNYQQGPGDGILGHVLGTKRPAVEKSISRSSGLDLSSVSSLLTMLAPILMGALGRSKQQGGLDAGSLAGLLGNERSRVEQAAPASTSILSKLLDSDGDGQVADDVGKAGISILSRLFGKRR